MRARLAPVARGLLERVAQDRREEESRSSTIEIDDDEKEINALVLRMLALRQPVAYDLRLLAGALRLVTDLERVGDEAVNIAERAREELGSAREMVRGLLGAMCEHTQEVLHRRRARSPPRGRSGPSRRTDPRARRFRRRTLRQHHPGADRVHDAAPAPCRGSHSRDSGLSVPRAGGRPRHQHRREGDLRRAPGGDDGATLARPDVHWGQPGPWTTGARSMTRTR